MRIFFFLPSETTRVSVKHSLGCQFTLQRKVREMDATGKEETNKM